MNARTACPIWGTPAIVDNDHHHSAKWVDSIRTGGKYRITTEAENRLSQLEPCHKARLTSWLVDRRKLGNECPEVYEETLKIEGEQRKKFSVPERANRLLHYIESEIVEIGTHFIFTSQEMNSTGAAAWSESVDADEVRYLLNYLCQQGWLERDDPSNANQYILTVKGYTQLAELHGGDTESSTSFVAMWFDNSTKEAWEKGIKPGIEDAGYEPVRIDQIEHNNKIDDEIIAEIRRSRFVVADFTQGKDGARGGVYYEAGFAHGLGLEVIFTCRKDILDNNDIHFDTRQYNHIAWETPEELRQKLAHRISASIGDGPLTRKDIKEGERIDMQATITIHHYDYGNRWFWALHTPNAHIKISPCDNTSEESCRVRVEKLQEDGALPQCPVITRGPQTPTGSDNRPICDEDRSQ